MRVQGLKVKVHSALMICLEIENSGDRLSGLNEWVKSPTETEKPVQAFHPQGLTRARTDPSTQRFPPPKIVPRKISGGNPAIGGDKPHKAIR